MVPILINKDVFEPSHNEIHGLKPQWLLHQYNRSSISNENLVPLRSAMSVKCTLYFKDLVCKKKTTWLICLLIIYWNDNTLNILRFYKN